jgi:hypothetical protein
MPPPPDIGGPPDHTPDAVEAQAKLLAVARHTLVFTAARRPHR